MVPSTHACHASNSAGEAACATSGLILRGCRCAVSPRFPPAQQTPEQGRCKQARLLRKQLQAVAVCRLARQVRLADAGHLASACTAHRSASTSALKTLPCSSCVPTCVQISCTLQAFQQPSCSAASTCKEYSESLHLSAIPEIFQPTAAQGRGPDSVLQPPASPTGDGESTEKRHLSTCGLT
jgi:hypothetical protein